MGFDQYHEPPQELSEKIRTFARMIASLIEEAEAIGWYEQRMSVRKRQGSAGNYGKRTKGEIHAFWNES